MAGCPSFFITAGNWTVSGRIFARPTTTSLKPFEVIDDIKIYWHPLPAEGRGALAYFHEYSAALFHEIRLLIKVYRERGFRSSRLAICPI